MLFDKNNLKNKIINGGKISDLLSSETPIKSKENYSINEIIRKLTQTTSDNVKNNDNNTQTTSDNVKNTKLPENYSINEIIRRLTRTNNDNNTQTPSDNVKNTKLPEKSDSNIPNGQDFFESQTDNLSCGRHALNNLLGSQIFVKENEKKGQVNLLNLCNNLKKLEEDINKLLNDKYHINIIKELGYTYFDICQKNENYEIKLLLFALLHVGKNAEIINNLDSIFTNNSNNLKMILNIGGCHWVSIISSSGLNGQHNYYDSMQSQVQKFNNRSDLYNHIKKQKVITYLAILLDDSINNSTNLVVSKLVANILVRYYAVKPDNLPTEKLKELLNDVGILYRNQGLHQNPHQQPSTTSSTPSTNFMIRHEGNIYAIGDIHGDIIPLIICLRDCCRVIRKKDKFDFCQVIIDTDIDNQMNKSWDDKTFVDDLNYEWCGENAYVVFCGDLLDNVRNGDMKKPGEFPFEEARIFKFINAINEQAMKKNGRLFKVLGNHDMANLNGNLYNNYISQFAKDYDGYKHGAKNRLDYFSKGKPGAELIGKDGAFLFLMINNFIFVHGGINTDLLHINNIEKVNKSLMKYIYNQDASIDFRTDGKSTEAKITFGNNNGLTLDRYFGHYKNSKTDTEMCNKLHAQFYKFVNSIKDNNKYKNVFSYDPNKMKLVIGHCTQVKVNRKDMYTTMFEKIIDKYECDNKIITSEEFGGIVSDANPFKKIFGITVSCGDRNNNNIMNLNDPSVFRIDIAMSRGFNSDYFPYFDQSRSPQVLKINNKSILNPVVTVIKSTVDNTNIHLTEQTTTYRNNKNSKYHSKYEKYKSKYIKLKNEIKND